jgi:purine-binding chemotaxis protein CheW
MKKEHEILLQDRARKLSLEPPVSVSGKEVMDVITFSLASETYAIESVFVREVYPLKAYTSLPGTPDFVLGIVNVRGQILSVINLKKFFHLPEAGIGELNKVIIVRNGRMEFGILADVVHGTRQIAKSLIQQPLPTITGIGADFLLGVTRDSLILLNIEHMLQDQSIIVDIEVN